MESSAERIILALDYDSKEQVTNTIKNLDGEVKFVKVGMELYYSEGPDIVRYLKDQGLKVFLDLKIHDIPNTAFKSMRSIAKLGADIINVHASGGVEMMKAARGALLEELGDYDISNSGRPSSTRPFLIGVTQLTSTNQEAMNSELGIPGTVEDSVIKLAENVNKAGLDGVVASAHEVEKIKEKLGAGFITITPGIKLKDNKANDQKRVMTPIEAVKIGTDYMVIGRAITQAEDPRKVFQSIVSDISLSMTESPDKALLK